MLSIIHAATSCCKSNHDKDLSEHLMILGSFHFTGKRNLYFYVMYLHTCKYCFQRILASNKTTSMTVVFFFAR